MFRRETEENPKMFQVFLNQAWHEVFCYAMGFEENQKNEEPDKLLFTIVSGSDTALQSIRGAIDIGSHGLRFGYGERGLTGYEFHSEKGLFSEKGKYEKFPMTLSNNRKALAVVHEDVLNNSKYVLSFDGNPAHDIAQLLGGPKYGLHILPEWEETIFSELIHRDYLREHQIYFDESLFPDGLRLYSIDLTEEEADQLIETLLKDKVITFPKEGTGEKLEEINDLTSYLLQFNNAMVEKLSESITPLHNPLEDEILPHLHTYPRELFPVQAHTATAVIKGLKERKAVIIQGEMSTGKSSVMTAIADGYHAMKGKKGYHVCLMCPPSLTKKWPEEIREIVPHAKVHVIRRTEDLIRYHAEWVRQGKPKPTVPTFFVISFSTMRDDARTVPAVTYTRKSTSKQSVEGEEYYREGFYCPNCGLPHQTVESVTIEIDENGNEIEIPVTHNMTENEFGNSRRIADSVKPANAFCFHCGESLWTKKVPTRYRNFLEWTNYEKKLLNAIRQGDPALKTQIQMSQPDYPKVVGMPRRVAAIEYIRRKMKNFFDISIVDEVHELKGGMTAQGHALGSLAAASKKIVVGTGTLFGGKAEDVYYLFWRLIPHEMVADGYQYKDVTRFNEEYGNIEEITYQQNENEEYSNKNSRGGRSTRRKVLPGISPFIYGRYMVHNVVYMRLKDVWPDPVELVDTPTIFVPMNEELKSHYEDMIEEIEYAINSREDGYKLYTQLTDYGIAYPDNPFSFPDLTIRNLDGTRDIIWKATHLDPNCTLPKEKKLQEIVEREMSEGRNCIVYVRDTGSSVKERDIRPRLKQKLEEIGAKVCILDTSTTSTDNRSDWLKQKIENEGYEVCIVSQELVKVGLDLLCTPTLIFYQFSWSLFTILQAARRAWRIGQTQECRNYYLAYADSYQQKMAQIIAMKMRATAAINGDLSSDGLSAMLGDEGDLQSMLIESIKNGEDVLKGSAEEWIQQTSDRAREILANIGKKKEKSTLEQFVDWVHQEIKGNTTKEAMLRKKEQLVKNIEDNLIPGFSINKGVLVVDLVSAFGLDRDFISDGAILFHLTKPQREQSKMENDSANVKIVTVAELNQAKRKKKISDQQLAFDLFG